MANLLLLSMSLFNRILSEHYYVADIGDYAFCGVSQLEAGTKYFLRKMQKDGGKIDKIIVIESHEVRNERKTVSSWLKSDSRGNLAEMTATEFYQARIIQYINGEEECVVSVPDLTEKVKAYEESCKNKASLKEQYPNPETLFETVEMEDGNSAVYDCIKEVCGRIKAFSGDERVKLYLDMQGARRYETFVINTAVKMLEISDIVVEESIAIDFVAGNTQKGKANYIVNTTDNNVILEMVSGMNEFIKTGRGDTLREFWKKYRRIPGIKDDGKVAEIIKQIRVTSDAISLCDVEGFDRNLSSLKRTIEDYEMMNDKEKQPLFQTFVVDLKEDYFGQRHNLLPADERMKIINQIRWCIEKKLYQQALAMVDEKIPENLAESGILHYGNKEELIRLINGMIRNGWNRVPGYLLKRGNNTIKEEKASLIWMKYIIECRKEKSKWIIDATTFTEYYMQSVTRNERSTNDDEVETEVGDLLKRYHALAEQRNLVMHATGENYDAPTIKSLLVQFANQYEDLLRRGIEYDYSKIRPLNVG